MDEEKKEGLKTERLTIASKIGFFLLLALFLWFPIGLLVTGKFKFPMVMHPGFLFSTSFAVIIGAKLFFAKKYHKPINYIFGALIAYSFYAIVNPSPRDMNIVRDSTVKAELHNVYLACKAYWADEGSDQLCGLGSIPAD